MGKHTLIPATVILSGVEGSAVALRKCLIGTSDPGHWPLFRLAHYLEIFGLAIRIEQFIAPLVLVALRRVFFHHLGLVVPDMKNEASLQGVDAGQLKLLAVDGHVQMLLPDADTRAAGHLAAVLRDV